MRSAMTHRRPELVLLLLVGATSALRLGPPTRVATYGCRHGPICMQGDFFRDLKKGLQAGFSPKEAAAERERAAAREAPSTPPASSLGLAAGVSREDLERQAREAEEKARAAEASAARDDGGDGGDTAADADAVAAEATGTDGVESEEGVDEAALFERAVEEARAAKASAASQRSRGLGFAAQSAAQSYVDSLVETSSAAVAPAPPPRAMPSDATAADAAADTAAQRAAREALDAKQRSLAAQQQPPPPPSSWLEALTRQALEGPQKIGAAALAALDEANSKAAAASAAEAAERRRRPKGNLNSLYRQLDRAIDRDDFEAAEEIKAQIEGIKGY